MQPTLERVLLLETAWLNWGRNAVIASVSGVALATNCNTNKRQLSLRRRMIPTNLMMGTGILFMNCGTIQYINAIQTLQTPTALAKAKPIAVALLANTAYTAAAAIFLAQANQIVE